jgi:transcriptional regulator with XRE-family HTH domain
VHPTFGALLRRYCLAAGLSQETLAECAGLGVRSSQALERGESQPLRDTLRRLARLAMSSSARTFVLKCGM